MWLSIVTYDLVASRALPDQGVNALATIREQRATIGGGDMDGLSATGFEAPANFGAIDPNSTTLTIKRNWSTQEKAQQFATFAAAQGDWITASVEQQI